MKFDRQLPDGPSRLRALWVSFSLFPFLLCACRPPGLSEFQPDISRGGRAAVIDVSPRDSNVALVGSDQGGIFRTADGGAHWSHVDAFPSVGISDLRFVPNTNPAAVLASTSPDGWLDPTVNHGGVWRSIDSGITWSHATLNSVCGAGVHAGRGISFVPNSNDVLLAADCGLVVSHDLGATWSSIVFRGPVTSVVAHSSSLIDICAWSGHLRSNDGGLTWPPDPTAPPRPDCAVPHSLAASPLEDNVLFGTSGGTVLESDTAGSTWFDLKAQPFNERPNWVKTRMVSATQFALHVPGETQTCGGGTGGQRCLTTWKRIPASSLNHDLNDIAFPPNGSCPQFVALDFGIVSADPPGTINCSDGSQWPLVGSGAAGYDALQIYDVIGQINQQGGFTNLYFGTQDNHVWANNDAKTSGWIDLGGNEGLGLQSPVSAAPIDPTFLGVTGAFCSNPCSDFFIPRTSSGTWGANQGWAHTDPPGSDEPPSLIEPQVYVQFKGNDLFMTTTMGSQWTKVASLSLRRFITLSQVGGPPSNPTIYLAVFKPSGGNALAKVTGIRNPAGAPQPGSVVNCIGAGCQPTFGTNLVNLHVVCLAIPCFGVFGVDPANANHIIAADEGTQQMKVSNDGGASWMVDDQLTRAVTMNGRLSFNSQPLSVYFDAANPNHVFVGTSQAGIVASVDGGQTWTTIVDSPKLTAITSFFFDSWHRFVYVATFSRGLWRLNMDPVNYKEVLTYVGATRSSSAVLPVTLAATFLNNSRIPVLPIANARISFQIGNPGPSCQALTDAFGRAQCNVNVYLPNGTYTLTTRFAGDAQYQPIAIGSYFYVIP
jgi:photosystem II stability/assembly factor-like uncharacterized protein